MPRATDAMIARYAGEIDERQKFMDGLVEAAQKDSRDLSAQEMELVTRAQERIGELAKLIEPLKEARRIASESETRLGEIADFMRESADEMPREVQYRSAGAYSIDMWRAGLGDAKAKQRLDTFNRAAAHQMTTDNPGLLPESIIGPVVSFVDSNRPAVSALGVRQLPAGSWFRPSINQHTLVGPQSAEKAELPSQKLQIDKVPVNAQTFGGYVNVSRQNVDWSQPQVMDIVINDLAAMYAVETETATDQDLVAASTAGPTIPTGVPTPEEIAGAFWTAAGSVYNATKGQGRLIAITGPDMLGLLGPLFPPINPVSAQSAGFVASSFGGPGPTGSISGIPLFVSAPMAASTVIVMSTAAAEVYEDRIGSLQVVEPSVLGVQVAYAGYFANVTLAPAGIVKITKTP